MLLFIKAPEEDVDRLQEKEMKTHSGNEKEN